MDPVATLRRLFDAAVHACEPARVLRAALPPRPRGRVVVVGAGKAAAAMAAAVESAWDGEISGLVVTRYGHGVPTRRIEVVEAGHPLPDIAGQTAAERTLALASSLGPDDLMLVLLSGGGSALWCAPRPPLDVASKQKITSALVRSRARIDEINCVRRHLSAIKGGRLAIAAYPASVATIAISDVPGDLPSVIASGPTVADPSTRADAMAVIRKYGLALPPEAQLVLEDPASGTPTRDDPRLGRSSFRIVARAADALAAACDAAHGMGLETQILSVNAEGDARHVGRAHAEITRHHDRITRPTVLLSGGELTLNVTGGGHGGPNREYLLALAGALEGHDRVWALAADTDGIDGSDDVAGGWITPDTTNRARAAGIDMQAILRKNDSAHVFSVLGQQIVTGPTRTNVNDFRAILIMPPV